MEVARWVRRRPAALLVLAFALVAAAVTLTRWTPVPRIAGVSDGERMADRAEVPLVNDQNPTSEGQRVARAAPAPRGGLVVEAARAAVGGRTSVASGGAAGAGSPVGYQDADTSTSAQPAAGDPYVGLHRDSRFEDFNAGARAGTTVEDQGGSGHVRLDRSALQTGNDAARYGHDRYWFGTLESPVQSAPHPFDTVIVSWNALTAPGTWIQIDVRAFRPGDGHWTSWYTMGVWASDSSAIRRHSVNGQGNADGDVATDTLNLSGGSTYGASQYRLTLFTLDPQASPDVRLVATMTSSSQREPEGLRVDSDRRVWGRDLPVPPRSQRDFPQGEAWCSPTSTSMVLGYWGRPVDVPVAADGTYDYVYDGAGNWPFNTAFASTLGMQAYVTRMTSLTQVEEWIDAGVPVIVSFAFGPGELPEAPIESSDGHLMVVRGFDGNGNVITNDPAGWGDNDVRRVYDRARLERVWLTNSGGTVYLIYPEGHPIPTRNALGSW